MAEETGDLRTRAQHLFSLCDKEEKGFVTKRDMQRMQSEMPLEPEQLELVFDSLDADGNGYLTFDEFIQGFGIYMENDVEESDGNVVQETKGSTSEADEMEDDENFMQLLDQLGGPSVFEDEKSVKVLWDHFRQDDPNAGFHFEKFLSNISDSIHNKEKEKVDMEEFIKTQNETREEEMKRLYEEMERQIAEEKELVIRMERMKESHLRNEMREELAKKDQQLTQLQTREKELQEALTKVQENENISKHDLAMLSKEKKALESQLEIQTRNAEELRSALEQLRRQSVHERRQRAMAALNVAENIAVEREGLVEQLSLLRNINTRLTDENDLREYGNGSGESFVETDNLAQEMEQASSNANRLLFSAEFIEDDDVGELVLDFDPPKVSMSTTAPVIKKNSLFDELSSALQVFETPSSSSQSLLNNLIREEPSGAEDIQSSLDSAETKNCGTSLEDFDRDSIQQQSVVLECCSQSVVLEATILPQKTFSATADESGVLTVCAIEPNHSVTWSTNILPTNTGNNKAETASLSNTDSLIGYHEGRWTHRVQLRKRQLVTPSGVFKIIVLGESGVGKTSFIRRFCCDDYIYDCGSTVGIDLSVRCLSVGDGKQVALQFWDTAGKRNRQEKYRSISRQYVRKADGVVIMYDVTSETSFLHVRYWIDCVKEVAGEDVVCVLVGNKTDLLEQQQETDQVTTEQEDRTRMTVTLTRNPNRVPTTTALQLAQNMGMDFFETSAQTGFMIQQAMVAMAAKLQIRERVTIEKVILDVASVDSVTTENEKGNKVKGKKCCRS